MEHLRIPDNKLLQTMLLYAEKSIPQIAKPLTQKLKKKGIRNSGWGSSMHDYTDYVLEYYAFDGNLVIEQNDRETIYDTRWIVSESLETFYNFFGEDEFELFFLIVHGINLKDGGKFDNNWYFGLEPFG